MRIRNRIRILFRFKTRKKYNFEMKNIFQIGKRILHTVPTKVQNSFGKAGNGFIVNFRTLLDPDPHSNTDPDPAR